MELTQEIVRELLDYDPETGVLTWKDRAPHHFPIGNHSQEHRARQWNATWAGKPAFTAKNGKGHLQGAISGKFTKAHRIIWFYMTGEWPEQIDHENGNPSDNRWENLRNVNNQTNQQNVSRRHDNSSGTTGVHWHKRDECWTATICVDGKNKWLGRFDSKDQAVASRLKANGTFGYHPNHGRSSPKA